MLASGRLWTRRRAAVLLPAGVVALTGFMARPVADARPAAVAGVEVVADGVCSLAEAILCANGDCRVSGDDCRYLTVSGDGAVEYDLAGARLTVDRRHDQPPTPDEPRALGAFRLFLPVAVRPVGHGAYTALPVVTGSIVVSNGALERPAAAPPLRFLEIADGGSMILRDVSLYGGDVAMWFGLEDGGAVLVRPGGDLRLDHSVLVRNRAERGGAIAAAGAAVHLTQSWLLDNTARAGGGGLSLRGVAGRTAWLDMVGGGVAGNRASHGGGGVEISTAEYGVTQDTLSAAFEGVTVSDNHTGGVGERSWGGGGIYAGSGGLVLTDTRLVANGAPRGGGLAVIGAVVRVLDGAFEGNAADDGGGLYVSSDGLVRVTGTTFTGNAARSGGGVSTEGALTLEQCDIADNVAAQDGLGGGLFAQGRGTLVKATTLRGNRAWCGGGIYHRGAYGLDVLLSTIAGNHAEACGGGVSNEAGLMTLIASTVAGNDLAAGQGQSGLGGAGIHLGSYGARLVLEGTIVAGNSGSTDCAGAPVESAGYNLDGGTSCRLRSAGDVSGADPRLAALGAYGGPTLTLALRSGSPALDRIPMGAAACGTEVTADQRGMPRPGEGSRRCDIGAYEK